MPASAVLSSFPLRVILLPPGVDAYVEFVFYFLEIRVEFSVEDFYRFYVLKFKFPDSIHRHLGYRAGENRTSRLEFLWYPPKNDIVQIGFPLLFILPFFKVFLNRL